MSTASNLSKSVTSASPTLVHFNQEFVQHLHGPHSTNLMDIAQSARNFVGLQPQEAENHMQDLNREGKIGWGTPIQENRRSQQQQPSREPWNHYGPPTLSPIQAPVRCFPESEDQEAKGQKRSWTDAGHFRVEDKDRKRIKTGYPMESKDLENEYKKIMTVPGLYPQIAPGGEMLGYFLPSSDPSKVLSKDLQQKMNKIDGEIATVEQTIINLKAKCNELSKVKMMSEKEDSSEAVVEVSESRPQTIARLIYSQNKLKAQQSHNILASLGAVTPLPLYNQPSDTLVYRENKKKFLSFKKLLVAHLAKKQQAEKIRIRYLSERYTQLYNQWVKKLNKRENSSFRKEKDAKFREAFEKVFPELKKQKEDKDKLQRFSVPGNRPAGYARSEAGIEEIVNELHEQEVKEKRMLSLSVTPPMMLDSRQRSLRIIDETRLIRSFDFRQKLWTTAESEIFAEKYQQFPKKFGIIASYLESKTVQDCVLFYYLTKKAANYKQMTRRYQAMRKRDKKFRTVQNVQNQDNKLGDGSSTLESCTSLGPGFSYMSTILLPNSSITQALSSNVVSTSSNSALNLASSSATSASAAEQQLKTFEPKKEAEAAKPGNISDPASEKLPEIKKTLSPEASKGSSPAAAVSLEAPQTVVKLEPSIENMQTEEEDAATKCPKENSTESKASSADVTDDKAPLKGSPQPPPTGSQESRSTAPTPSPAPAPVEPPALDMRDTTHYAFPGMRVEDISDKEDSDSVATLSADEGPTMLPEENKEPSQGAIKRPRLLDDNYKDGMDKKKHAEDLILKWDAKNALAVSKRHASEDGPKFYMVPNAERFVSKADFVSIKRSETEMPSMILKNIKSLPPTEQDQRQEAAYPESTESDLMYSLVRKNRSPARIKDLIHAAIEKNLQNSNTRMEGDVNGCASPLSNWPSRGETPINRMPSPQIQSILSQHQLQHHYQYQKQHNLPMDPPADFPPSRHPALRSPATANSNDLAQQHLAMKMMNHDRPNSYSPSYYQPPLLNSHEVAPPPAHAHHQGKNVPYEKPSSRGPPAQYLENNRLYELAAIAAERGRMDEKEKRAHKEAPVREAAYPGSLPLSLLRLPCDPVMLHKSLAAKGNSVGIHPTGSLPPQVTGMNVGSGRGSITKGTSGRSEALQQQGPAVDRPAAPLEWPVPPRTTIGYPLGALQNQISEYPSSAHVLRGDYLIAHQMSQSHLSQQSQLYHLQQLQHHYQGLARQTEKKHRQSPATSGHEALLHNKNNLNQEPVKKKARAVPEGFGKNVYPDQAECPLSHKNAPSVEDIHKQVPVDSRTHSRGHQSGGYYYNAQEAPHYVNEGSRPKSLQQQVSSGSDKLVDHPKLGKKEFQPPNQMTAANLIEAIIYLQINRNENDDVASKTPSSSVLSGSTLLSNLTNREEILSLEKNSRIQMNPQHVMQLSKAYEKSQKFSQIQSQFGDYSIRQSENRIVDRAPSDKIEESPHALISKHVKDPNPSKRFAPYDLMNQPRPPSRPDPQVVNPQPPPGGKKFITASDRIEAIIAQDIGNQEDLPVHNENVQSLIKEYMRVSDSKPTKFDSLGDSLLARFPYASVRPFDLDKAYDKSFMPFYAPGMIVPLRMPLGPPEDRPPSSQGIMPNKVWQHHGLHHPRPERETVDSRAPPRQINTSDSKHNSIPTLVKEQRSENDGMPTLRQSPSHHQLQNQFQHGPKLNSSDYRNMAHVAPSLQPEPPVASSSERVTSKEVSCSDSSNSSGTRNANSPPPSSHMNWKAKMLRQHKEQKMIAESNLNQHHSSETSSHGVRSFKEELGERSEEGRARDEGRFESEHERKDHGQRSSSTASNSPVNGRPSSVSHSPITKPPIPIENSSDGRVESAGMATPSNYWSPRLSTRKRSSNSSDGLRIDLPTEEEEEEEESKNHEDSKHN